MIFNKKEDKSVNLRRLELKNDPEFQKLYIDYCSGSNTDFREQLAVKLQREPCSDKELIKMLYVLKSITNLKEKIIVSEWIIQELCLRIVSDTDDLGSDRKCDSE